MRGTPVLASDIPVSREVAGEYCLWFEQDNPDQICGIVKDYQEHEEKYQALKKSLSDFRAVSWEESARLMAGVLDGA